MHENTRDGRPVLSLSEIEAFDPGCNASRALCPLCGSEKPKDAAHRSLSLDRATGLWKCFRCGAAGTLREFWREQGQSRADAGVLAPRGRNVLQSKTAFRPSTQKSSRSFPAFAPDSASNQAEAKPSKSDWRAKWERTIDLENTRGAAYLQGRGIALQNALVAGARFHPNWSGHAAVVFPLKNRDDEIVAAQARAVEGEAKLTGGPKIEGAFLAPVKMKTGRVFSPLDSSTPVIAITEAPIDALSLACAGFPALALCGTSGPRWLHVACGLRRVALALDADEAGEKASGELERVLTPFGAKCQRVLPENAKDWNEMLLQSGAGELGDFLAEWLL